MVIDCLGWNLVSSLARCTTIGFLYFSLGVEAFERLSLSLHVHGMVQVIVHSILLVKDRRAVTLHPREEARLVPVDAGDIVFGYRVDSNLSIIRNDM